MKYLSLFPKLLLPLLACTLSQTVSFAQITNGGWVTGVTAIASSEQFGASNTVSDAGLTETAPGNGIYQLAAQADWTTQSIAPSDVNGAIQFDLGFTPPTVNRFRVWNYNEPNFTFRSFKDTVIQYSDDGLIWKTTPQNFIFAQAPGTGNYLGQEFTFNWPIQARFIRFWCDSTYGPREQCGLGKVRFFAGGTATTPPLTSDIWPADARVINVKEAPYFAVGNGIADDYNAIQTAIQDYEGTMRMIYLPAGTYRVSQPLKCRNNNEPVGTQRNGFTWIRGATRDTTVIKLDNGVLTDIANSKHLLYTGLFNDNSGNSANWFNNTITDLTLDTGSNNPAAKGLGFYSNKTGIVRNVKIRSGDGQGLIGLDCGYASQNGPNTIKNVTVDGFKTGFITGGAVNSQTLEDITLTNQSEVALQNEGQVLSIRNLTTSGNVPAIRSTSSEGFITLINASLSRTGSGPPVNAIENVGLLLARDVTAIGFTNTLNNTGGPGGNRQIQGFIREYVSGAVISQFPNEGSTLRLPVEDTPPILDDAPSTWANVRNFRRTTERDIGLAAQRAIDSGATTVYFPTGIYFMLDGFQLRGAVRHLACQFSTFALVQDFFPQITLNTGTTPAVTIDNLRESISGQLGLIITADRTLSCRNIAVRYLVSDQWRGRVFIENFVARNIGLSVGSDLWARGLNLEDNLGLIFSGLFNNNGGNTWILGLKAEGNDTLVNSNFGGQTELLGGLYYSRTSQVGTPMLSINDSRVSFSMAEVNSGAQAFDPVVVEARSGVSRTLAANQVPSAAGGALLALYCSKRPLVSAKITPIAGSQMRLTWNTVPLREYYIQSSTDLINWQRVANSSVFPSDAEFIKTFDAPNNGSKRFYRAALDNKPILNIGPQ